VNKKGREREREREREGGREAFASHFQYRSRNAPSYSLVPSDTMRQSRDNDVAGVNDRDVSLSGFGKKSNALF